MAASFLEIVTGKTEAEVFADILTRLQGRGLPTVSWATADPQQVVLEHGHSPLLALLYGYASTVAQGGLLRLAARLAELQADVWEADPQSTFLGWLAPDWYAVDPLPPAFTIGALRLINTTGAALTVPRGASFRTDTGLIFKLAESGAVLAPVLTEQMVRCARNHP